MSEKINLQNYAQVNTKRTKDSTQKDSQAFSLSQKNINDQSKNIENKMNSETSSDDSIQDSIYKKYKNFPLKISHDDAFDQADSSFDQSQKSKKSNVMDSLLKNYQAQIVNSSAKQQKSFKRNNQEEDQHFNQINYKREKKQEIQRQDSSNSESQNSQKNKRSLSQLHQKQSGFAGRINQNENDDSQNHLKKLKKKNSEDDLQKDSHLKERQEQLEKQKEQFLKMIQGDQQNSIIKIQQLFQETKNINQQMINKNRFLKKMEESQNSRSFSSSQDYSPVRRPISRSSAAKSQSKERNLSSSNKYKKQKKVDESIEEEKSMNWPKQFVDINEIMNNNYPLQNELDHDEELYTDVQNQKNKNEGRQKPITDQNQENKLMHLKQDLDDCHDQIARQASQNHFLQVQVQSLTTQLEKMRDKYSELSEKSDQKQKNFEQMIQNLTKKLKAQQGQNNDQEEKRNQVALMNDELVFRIQQMERENSQLRSEYQSLQKELEMYEIQRLDNSGNQNINSLNQENQNNYSFTAIKIELEQLRKDNQKLQAMLKTTKEYGQFGEFVEDSGGMAIRLPQQQQASKAFQENEILQVDDEIKQWVPSEAFNLAHNFRARHGNDLSSDLINQMLADLNAIWLLREKKQLQRLKQKHQEEMTKLKRQLVSKVPYDALFAKKQISRLTSELSNIKQNFQKNQAMRDKNQKAPVGVELIDNTLVIISEIQQQKKQLQTENEDLKQRIQRLQQIKIDSTIEKRKYMEGAVWMGKKMTSQIEKVCQSFEFLLIEYQQRIQGQSQREQSSQNSEKNNGLDEASFWLIEAIKQAGYDLYEKSITILESAVFHFEDSDQIIKKKNHNQHPSIESYSFLNHVSANPNLGDQMISNQIRHNENQSDGPLISSN